MQEAYLAVRDQSARSRNEEMRRIYAFYVKNASTQLRKGVLPLSHFTSEPKLGSLFRPITGATAGINPISNARAHFPFGFAVALSTISKDITRLSVLQTVKSTLLLLDLFLFTILYHFR